MAPPISKYYMAATSVPALEKLRADLLARAAKLETTIADAKRRGTRDQAAILDALPKKLGVENMEAVAAMLRARIRGEFGPLTVAPGADPAKPKRAAPTRLTEVQYATMDQLLTQLLVPGYVGELTTESIAQTVGCGTATVANRRAELKKEIAAMVQPITPAAPAADTAVA